MFPGQSGGLMDFVDTTTRGHAKLFTSMQSALASSLHDNIDRTQIPDVTLGSFLALCFHVSTQRAIGRISLQCRIVVTKVRDAPCLLSTHHHPAGVV